jgi:hypothetical protein
MIGACSSAGRRTGSDIAHSAECGKLGEGGFAGNGAHPLEQLGLPGHPRCRDGRFRAMLDQGEVDLLAEGRAKGHAQSPVATRDESCGRALGPVVN